MPIDPVSAGLAGASLVSGIMGSKSDAKARAAILNAIKQATGSPRIESDLERFYSGYGAYSDQSSNALWKNILNMLTNPGQTSTVGYERAQEQAEATRRGLSTLFSSRGAQAGIGGGGSMGLLQLVAALNAGKLRNEAARDQTLMEEQLRRQDIQIGANLYNQILQSIFGLAAMRGSALAGTNYQPAPSTGTQLAQALGMFATMGAQNDWFKSSTPTTPTTPGPWKDGYIY